jgi:hypothetical protein
MIMVSTGCARIYVGDNTSAYYSAYDYVDCICVDIIQGDFEGYEIKNITLFQRDILGGNNVSN